MRIVQSFIGCGIAAAIAMSGCAHDRADQRAERRAERAADRAEDAFESAYDSVRSGARSTARSGEYAFERSEGTGVRIWRGTKEIARDAGRGISDGWITTKVKSKYAASSDVRARSIDVDTKDGVVTLTGDVESPAEATQAIRHALETDGVVEVRSRLSYPAFERRYQRGY